MDGSVNNEENNHVNSDVVTTPLQHNDNISSSKQSASNSRNSMKGQKRVETDFIFGKLIGEGSFSSVYLAKDIHTQKEYAAKVCSKMLISKEKKVTQVLREKEIMNLLNVNDSATAPFFVRLAFAFQSEANLYFILSYCKYGEFLGLIHKVLNFDQHSARFYTGELVRALEHLNSLNIVHRDLKPENILLDDKMHIKISDFGSATILEKMENDTPALQRGSSFVGTAQYVSPEMLNNKKICLASDLWALGCIVYQIVSGLTPFRAKSDYLIFKEISRLDYEFPPGFFEDAKDMVQRLIILEPSSRLGAGDPKGSYPSLREHPFLRGLDLDTLYLATPPTITTFTPDQHIWDNSVEPGLEERELQLLHDMVISTKPASNSNSTSTTVNSNNGTTNASSSNANATGSLSCNSDSTAVHVRSPSASERGRRNLADISQDEHDRRLEAQKTDNKWHKFVEGNLILKQGLLDKRKGLFPRRRAFLLTTGPHLYYVDPVNQVLKGQVPFTRTLAPEGKNFRTFVVHTPNRTYYLEDPLNTSHQWMEALEEVRDYYFPRDL